MHREAGAGREPAGAGREPAGALGYPHGGVVPGMVWAARDAGMARDNGTARDRATWPADLFCWDAHKQNKVLQ